MFWSNNNIEGHDIQQQGQSRVCQIHQLSDHSTFLSTRRHHQIQWHGHSLIKQNAQEINRKTTKLTIWKTS